MKNTLSFLKISAEGIYLKLYVSPSSKVSEVVGIHGDSLKFRVSSPPVDGRANKEICKFFSTLLDISLTRFTIVAGKSSKNKRFFISLSDPDIQDEILLKFWKIIKKNEEKRRNN